jgi:tRNA nucleotidyltransferase/poly(A) polymerase
MVIVFVSRGIKALVATRHRKSHFMMALDSRQLRFCNIKSGGGSVATLLGEKMIDFRKNENSNNNVSNFFPPQTIPHKIELTNDERKLFDLLRQVTTEKQLGSTLRVAGGWVRDKLLATPEFQNYHRHHCTSAVENIRRTSKFQKSTQASLGRQGTKVVIDDDDHQPVDIDIALDDMLGREFADHLNEYLQKCGEEAISVGVVLKNPEKSKHLETATMKVGSFWIDFVNLRAEEYTQDSRIPDLMRIGTPTEDALRRDLTINSLFYNINTQQIEDFTGNGFVDLQRGTIATPLAPLTTLLDDPLRVLRAIRFAARLRFNMDGALITAAKDSRVRNALEQKVSRERIGGEVDLMLRSPDPVGAMRLLINLNLVETVFPFKKIIPEQYGGDMSIYTKGLSLLSSTFDYLCDNKRNPPVWCEQQKVLTTHGFSESTLLNNEEARRLLWYSAFLKPLHDFSNIISDIKPHPQKIKKLNRSVISKLLVDHLKRPTRDATDVEKILRSAEDFSRLMESGLDISAESILLSGIVIKHEPNKGHESSESLYCKMGKRKINSETEDDPIWLHAMEFRCLISNVLTRIGHLWRAAFVLSLVDQLTSMSSDLEYTIEGDVVRFCPCYFLLMD